MKVVGLDGREYNFNVLKYQKEYCGQSSLHIEAHNLLQTMFPGSTIYEEIMIPGTRLTIDMFVLPIRLLVEVHGEQHYKYVPFMHGSQENFVRSQANDSSKKLWAELNDIYYVELPFNKIPEWKSIINESIS